jgi:tetratricopeptide (TPR) repeat protein
MNTIREILNELKLAEDVGDWKKCIHLCRESLSLIDQSHPEAWFKVRFNFANFLQESDQPEDIEEAIKILHELLTNISQEKKPEKYAAVALSLGMTYDRRTRGNRQENLEKVIEYYNQALTVFKKDNYPEEWAMTKAGIGFAYAEKKTGHEKENLLNAIEHYEATLEVYTKNAYPEDYEDSMQELARLQERLNALKKGSEVPDE